MDLDELVATIARVRERSERFRSELTRNEAQTRISLIDPVLRALGWPLEDPDWVQVEAGLSSGSRADYVLCDGVGRPVIVLEAKALGGKMDLASSAAVGYAWELMKAGKEPKLVGVTDGLHWVLAEPHSLKTPKAIVDFTKNTESPAMLALDLARLLWRGRWERPLPPSPPPRGEWIPLTQFVVTPGSPPPQRIRFPDGAEVELSLWKQLLAATAEWLMGRGILTPARTPVLTSPNYALVHTEPVHPDGRPMRSIVQLSNGLYLDVHASAPQTVARARKLLQHCGSDPATVLLLPR